MRPEVFMSFALSLLLPGLFVVAGGLQYPGLHNSSTEFVGFIELPHIKYIFESVLREEHQSLHTLFVIA